MIEMTDIFSYLSWNENEVDSLIIDFVNKFKEKEISSSDIDLFLELNGLNYFDLSPFAREKLDELEITLSKKCFTL